VLDELIATGRFGRISDQDVRQAAGQLMRLRDDVRSAVDVVASSALDLPFGFPELMRRGLEATDAPDDIDGYISIATCEGEAMRGDVRFLNGFSSNVANYNVYYLANFIELSPAYEQLHQSLDRAIGITHGGDQ
jgi:hypothetical protein